MPTSSGGIRSRGSRSCGWPKARPRHPSPRSRAPWPGRLESVSCAPGCFPLSWRSPSPRRISPQPPEVLRTSRPSPATTAVSRWRPPRCRRALRCTSRARKASRRWPSCGRACSSGTISRRRTKRRAPGGDSEKPFAASVTSTTPPSSSTQPARSSSAWAPDPNWPVQTSCWHSQAADADSQSGPGGRSCSPT